jgi:sulfoacetaldehyde dehydrogenase
MERTMSVVVEMPNQKSPAQEIAADLVRKARAAQEAFAEADQARVDEAVRALAWSLYKLEHAKELAELAVEDTGLGNVPDKIIKKQRKTFGTLRDLLRAKSVGEIERDEKRGIVKFAKPIGVVGAVTPSTNPGATPVNKAMMAIKGRNAIIIAPSPLGYRTTNLAVEYMRKSLLQIGLPADLVQILPNPVTKDTTQALMEAVDLVVVTGSQDNVRRAYSSGTPAIGVGAGNVPVIIDETANLDDAAKKICASKTFDNATSCSSENAIVIVDAVYDKAIEALKRAGGYFVNASQKANVVNELWKNGKLNRHLIARDMPVLAKGFGLPDEAAKSKFLMVEETGIGRSHPLSGEKLALVLTVYRASDFKAAKETIRKILNFQGKGHSMGLHTTNMARARARGGFAGRARADQFRPHFRQWRRLRQRPRIHTLYGLRLLAEELDLREPELQALPQHHAPRDTHSRGQAERGSAVRAALEKIRKIERSR